MAKAKKIWKPLLVFSAGAAGLIAARLLFKMLFFCVFEQTLLNDRIASACAILLLWAFTARWAKRRKIQFPYAPRLQSKGARSAVWAGMILGALLILITPFLTGASTPEDWFLLLYASVLTPLYEETLFRGILWEKLLEGGMKEGYVLLLTSFLFAIWHFGYFDSLLLRAQSNQLGWMLLMKAAVGLGYGIMTGLARKATNSTLAAMVLHGIMNTVGR